MYKIDTQKLDFVLLLNTFLEKSEGNLFTGTNVFNNEHLSFRRY
jgi:hypothetical protein